jgi:CelD/BcsL family acetyltransferase involved in cellulose biosynthesis
LLKFRQGFGTTLLIRRSNRMRVCEVDTTVALERLRPEWIELWERTPNAGPFQHPDWLLAWWQHIGDGKLLVLTAYEGAALVAVAPFYIYSDQASGVRQLTLLGNGIADRGDILICEETPEAEQALGESMLTHRKHWNCYDFRDVPANSSLVPLVCQKIGGSISEDTPHVVISLDAWKAGGSGELPARALADLRRRRRRAEEFGRVRLELAHVQNVDRALERLFALHAARWHARGEAGVLAQSSLESFHRDIAERFAGRGWLRLHLLYIGDRLIAANYGFCVKRRAYSYIGGFDPEMATLGPGRIIVHEMIKYAVEEGAEEFDFLRGDEEYKRRWGGEARQQYRLSSFSCCKKG